MKKDRLRSLFDMVSVFNEITDTNAAGEITAGYIFIVLNILEETYKNSGDIEIRDDGIIECKIGTEEVEGYNYTFYILTDTHDVGASYDPFTTGAYYEHIRLKKTETATIDMEETFNIIWNKLTEDVQTWLLLNNITCFKGGNL